MWQQPKMAPNGTEHFLFSGRVRGIIRAPFHVKIWRDLFALATLQLLPSTMTPLPTCQVGLGSTSQPRPFRGGFDLSCIHPRERGRNTRKEEELFQINENLYKMTVNIISMESRQFIAIRKTRFWLGLPTGLAELGGV